MAFDFDGNWIGPGQPTAQDYINLGFSPEQAAKLVPQELVAAQQVRPIAATYAMIPGFDSNGYPSEWRNYETGEQMPEGFFPPPGSTQLAPIDGGQLVQVGSPEWNKAVETYQASQPQGFWGGALEAFKEAAPGIGLIAGAGALGGAFPSLFGGVGGATGGTSGLIQAAAPVVDAVPAVSALPAVSDAAWKASLGALAPSVTSGGMASPNTFDPAAEWTATEGVSDAGALTQAPAPVVDKSFNAGISDKFLNSSPSLIPEALTNGASSAAVSAAARVAAGSGTAADIAAVTAAAKAAGSSVPDWLKLALPLVGAAAGGIGVNSKPAGVTTTVQDLPDWLKPYVTGNLDAAKAYMAANPQNNSLLDPARAELNKTIAGDYLNSNPANAFYSGAQNYVNPGIANLQPGASGAYVGTNPADPYYRKAAEYTNTSMDYLRPTAEGKFLNANPYIDAMYAKARDAVGTGIDSRFSKAGRYGSGAHQGVLGTTFDNLATDIYGNNYATERANMLSAGGTLISADQAQQAARLAGAAGLGTNYTNERNQQLQFGQAQTAAEQAQQAARLAGASGLGANWNTARTNQTTAAGLAPGFTTDAATAPFAAFNAFGNLTKGLGVSQTSSPYFTNPVGGALSGALAGYGLSKAFG